MKIKKMLCQVSAWVSGHSLLLIEGVKDNYHPSEESKLLTHLSATAECVVPTSLVLLSSKKERKNCPFDEHKENLHHQQEWE